MKKSKKIVLVLSGAAALSFGSGCGQSNYQQAAEHWVEDSQSYTNNHYVPGQGYYHSGARGWFPYPYNHFIPGQGYYSGGTFHQTAQPALGATAASRPLVRSTSRPTSSRSSGSVSRGGFGGRSSAAS